MKVLVVGGGGREHALAWKLRQSPLVDKIYCAPGNGGLADLAECVPLKAEDIQGLLAFARTEGIGLTVVGPEAPLVAGLADAFREAGLRVFGPSARAAAIEGSKVWAKEFMARHGIPTAAFRTFQDAGEARRYVLDLGAPCVIKADGLAAGKGVVVAREEEEALRALNSFLEEDTLGQAGRRVVVEECLEGEELSVLALTDGKSILPLAPAQDHKRAWEGDRGPNTGGMGAYSPVPFYTPEVARAVEQQILHPAVEALDREGRPFHGVLYAGLMLTSYGPRVLEFNCRFGDPETQPLMLRLKSDLADLLLRAAEGRLSGAKAEWEEGSAACVVLASRGYPGPCEQGLEIRGLEAVPPGVEVFHAGTKKEGGRYLTAGGRLLGVTAAGPDLPAALRLAYSGVEAIDFPGKQYRRDVGQRAQSFTLTKKI